VKRADRVLLACALVVAALLRMASLALPHDRGDQVIWASVARNIAERGRAGYTLRGLDPSFAGIEGGAAVMSFTCVEGKGRVLESFVAGGEKYWDSPLLNQPPGFFAVLLASHMLLGTRGDGFPLLARDPLAERTANVILDREEGPAFRRRFAEIQKLPEGEREPATRALEQEAFAAQTRWQRDLVASLLRHPAWSAVRAQLWATLPPLLADLATGAIVFLAAFSLGGRFAALLAAGLWACDPIAIFCADRVLSNTALTAACALALLLEGVALSREKASPGLALAIGLACAVAISIKVSAVFLLPAILVGRFLRGRLDRDALIAVGLALLVAAPWWIVQWRVHGHPFGFAWRTQPDRLLVSPWGRHVTSQGPLYYALTLARSPAVAFGVVAGFLLLRAPHSGPVPASRGEGARATALIFSVLVLLAAFSFEEKEARHLLLAYPPLVVFASAWIAARAEKGASVPWILGLLVLLLWQASHGVALAIDVVTTP
jgi:hypothetical protein